MSTHQANDASSGRLPEPPDNSAGQSGCEAFVWSERSVYRTLACPRLSALAPHLFTDRQLEFRGETVDKDYEALARLMEVPADVIVRVRQVHGREVLVLMEGDRPPAPGVAAADAVVTTDPRLVPSVRIADCVPILIADERRRVVAAVHAGWRGTAAGVAVETVKRIAALGIDPDSLVAAIGPSIGPCCYQVDRVVRAEFDGMWPEADAWFAPEDGARFKLDLWRANRDQLIAAGLRPESIWTAGLCTADHLDLFFSHRKEGERAGRMVAAIRLRG
jgi:YfiH family protein